MADKLYFQREDRSPMLLGSYTQYGYGRRKVDIPPALVASKTPVVLFWFNMVLFKLSTGATILSLCFVYAGLFQMADTLTVRISRVINRILVAVVVFFYTATFLTSIFQCTPIQKAWISKAAVSSPGFWVIALPLPVLFKLSTRAREVTQIILLVLLGGVYTRCVIARLVLQLIPNKDPDKYGQWANTVGNSTSMVELFVGIIAACLVVMRPCFQGVARKVFGTTIDGTRSRANNSNSLVLRTANVSRRRAHYEDG
ncbi:hypothetical protein BKA65DRAFT_575762 [Rhexocercosporidium sp. MPI-PUGE-AT-0058]|nr:hypothetical protein BKA65DRAFT_575762 [Rhexocercosporidium sp. MPI-PUGE-AT-0058]